MPSSRYYAPALSCVGSTESCECMPCPVTDVDAIHGIECGTRGTLPDAPRLGARSGTRQGRDMEL